MVLHDKVRNKLVVYQSCKKFNPEYIVYLTKSKASACDYYEEYTNDDYNNLKDKKI